MRDNACSYDTATELAENAANVFDLYEDDIDYIIPEWVFETALDFIDVD